MAYYRKKRNWHIDLVTHKIKEQINWFTSTVNENEDYTGMQICEEHVWKICLLQWKTSNHSYVELINVEGLYWSRKY